MSAELSITIQGSFVKNNLQSEKFGAPGLTIDVAGKNVSRGTQNVGTADETLPLGDIGTIGSLWAKNTDPTNYVTLGADNTNQPNKIPPKGQIFTGWNGAAVHIKANTAACDVQFCIIEA